jgi:hypothetical protein
VHVDTAASAGLLAINLGEAGILNIADLSGEVSIDRATSAGAPALEREASHRAGGPEWES